MCSLPFMRSFKQLQDESTLELRGNHLLLNLLHFCDLLIGEGLLFLLEVWLKCLRLAQLFFMGKRTCSSSSSNFIIALVCLTIVLYIINDFKILLLSISYF